VDYPKLPLAIADAERRLADKLLDPGSFHGSNDIPCAFGEGGLPPGQEQDGKDGHAQFDEQGSRPRKGHGSNDDLAREDNENHGPNWQTNAERGHDRVLSCHSRFHGVRL
jgi:hypothetical protein